MAAPYSLMAKSKRLSVKGSDSALHYRVLKLRLCSACRQRQVTSWLEELSTAVTPAPRWTIHAET